MTDTASPSTAEPSNDPSAQIAPAVAEPGPDQPDSSEPETDKPDPRPDRTEPPAAISQQPMPAPAADPEPRKSGSTFLGIVIGAAIAGGVGYGVQRYLPQQAAFDPSAIEARLADAESQNQSLRAELERLSQLAQPTPAPDPALIERIAAVEAIEQPDVAPLVARIDRVEANLAALADLPSETGVSPAALAALQAEMAALKSQGGGASSDLTALIADVEARLTAAEASAANLAAQATAIAAEATRNAALGQIAAAFDSGLPYRAALTSLGDEAVPDVIAGFADTGLPSVAVLRAAFPDAARLALEQALRANPGENWTDRVGTFLRNQTGARSLAPREGTDPDAVLSRAEAALARADVAAALTEIAALPPEAQAVLADWSAQARQRLDAQAALTGLMQQAGK